MRIAIIGSGVAGLTCAHLLSARHEVIVYETDRRPGGHANTVAVELDGATHEVDTGFIVYNERNYPIFSSLLDELDIESRATEMSFAVADDVAGIEWRGSSPASIFAQPRNLARPAFLAMLRDIIRFNRAARALLEAPADDELTLDGFIARHRWSRGFRDWYLIPMGSAIWSCDPSIFGQFPAAAFARFFDNHGLLGLGERPQWRTVIGGSRRYVTAIVAPLGSNLRLNTKVTKLVRRRSGVEIATDQGTVEHFDHVIVATHSNDALSLLSDPTDAEREVLSALRYQPNDVALHTDQSLLPRRTRARASWNWRNTAEPGAATLTYDLSRLQGLESSVPICLTLNQTDAVDPAKLIDTMTYWHPVFDARAMAAQRRHGEISGRDGVSYAGAYWGYGFHEDGARSALEVCENLGVTWPVRRR
jgi:predicted NAD/FAD-binding protein